MSITTLYHVNVDIPEAVYREFGHTPEYYRKSLEATQGHVAAGQNSYSSVEEWAEFHSYDDALSCQKRLMDMNYYFAAKLGDAK